MSDDHKRLVALIYYMTLLLSLLLNFNISFIIYSFLA